MFSNPFDDRQQFNMHMSSKRHSDATQTFKWPPTEITLLFCRPNCLTHHMEEEEKKLSTKQFLGRSRLRFHFLTGCVSVTYYCASRRRCMAHSSVCDTCTPSGCTVPLCRYSNLYKLIISWHMQQCCLIKTIGSSDILKTTQTSLSMFS